MIKILKAPGRALFFLVSPELERNPPSSANWWQPIQPCGVSPPLTVLVRSKFWFRSFYLSSLGYVDSKIMIRCPNTDLLKHPLTIRDLSTKENADLFVVVASPQLQFETALLRL